MAGVIRLRMAKDGERIKGFNKQFARWEEIDVKTQAIRIRNARPALQAPLENRAR